MMTEKDLAKAEKEKKDLYLQACLKHRRTFTHMVYSANVIPGAEALAAQKRLAALLSYELKREYLEMCGLIVNLDAAPTVSVPSLASPPFCCNLAPVLSPCNVLLLISG